MQISRKAADIARVQATINTFASLSTAAAIGAPRHVAKPTNIRQINGRIDRNARTWDDFRIDDDRLLSVRPIIRCGLNKKRCLNIRDNAFYLDIPQR